MRRPFPHRTICTDAAPRNRRRNRPAGCQTGLLLSPAGSPAPATTPAPAAGGGGSGRFLWAQLAWRLHRYSAICRPHRAVIIAAPQPAPRPAGCVRNRPPCFGLGLGGCVRGGGGGGGLLLPLGPRPGVGLEYAEVAVHVGLVRAAEAA
eukprot:scaffold1406_cov115-Isochrysis_galbana.AAC.7